MAVVKNLILRAGADFSGVSKSMKKAQRDVMRFKQNFQNTARRVMQISIVVGTATVLAAKKAIDAADEQIQQGVKLATVMKQRMKATDAMVDSVKKLASEQQTLGIIDEELQLAGAQQLATFLNQSDSLNKLIPAMNNLAAQQKGVNATSSDMVNIANMMGKVFTGQIGALKRVGISFTEAEGKVLSYGSESEKAAMLAQVITSNVGEMNSELAKTPLGQMQQLKNEIGDLWEYAGMVVMPIRNALIPATRAMIGNFQALIDKLRPTIALAQIFIETLFNVKATKNSEKITGGVENQADAYDDLGDSAKQAKKSVMGFDEVNQLQEDTEDSALNAASASAKNSDAMEKEKSVVDDLGDSFILTAEQIESATKKAKEFKQTMEDVKGFLSGFLKGLSEGIEDTWVVKLFKYIFGLEFEKAKGDMESVGESFGKIAIYIGEIYAAVKLLEGVKWFMSLLGVKGASSLGGAGALKAFLATPFGLILVAALGLEAIQSIAGFRMGDGEITAEPLPPASLKESIVDPFGKNATTEPRTHGVPYTDRPVVFNSYPVVGSGVEIPSSGNTFSDYPDFNNIIKPGISEGLSKSDIDEILNKIANNSVPPITVISKTEIDGIEFGRAVNNVLTNNSMRRGYA